MIGVQWWTADGANKELCEQNLIESAGTAAEGNETIRCFGERTVKSNKSHFNFDKSSKPFRKLSFLYEMQNNKKQRMTYL